MQVLEFMSPPSVVVAPTTPIRDVLRLCLDYDLHYIPVTDGDKFLGIVSDKDVERELFLNDEQILTEDIVKTPALKIMSLAVGTLSPELSFDEALNTFLEMGKSLLPVIDSEKNLVGVVTAMDFLKAVRTIFMTH